jgi:hypothetical protein
MRDVRRPPSLALSSSLQRMHEFDIPVDVIRRSEIRFDIGVATVVMPQLSTNIVQSNR